MLTELQRKVAERIRDAMRSRSISQNELASATGLSQTSLSHFMCARRLPRGDNLVLLADALLVSVDYLLGRVDSMDQRSETPKWTVLTNVAHPRWIGTCWQFFDSEDEASDCCAAQHAAGNAPTMRPFHPSDRVHMGAVHR